MENSDGKGVGVKKWMPDARFYLSTRYSGKSPAEAGAIKCRKVCAWIYRHGFSSASLINCISGQQAPGYANKLVKAGYLIATPSASGTPKFIYTLSDAGLELASAHAEYPIDYKWMEPWKISQTLVQHDLIVQEIAFDGIHSLGFEYISKQELALKHDKGVKVPDGLFLAPSLEDASETERICFEVEWSQKTGKKLDWTVDAISSAFLDGLYDWFFYYVRADVIANNYAKAMAPGAALRRWKKLPNGTDIRDLPNDTVVPKGLLERVKFILIDRAGIFDSDPRTR